MEKKSGCHFIMKLNIFLFGVNQTLKRSSLDPRRTRPVALNKQPTSGYLWTLSWICDSFTCVLVWSLCVNWLASSWQRCTDRLLRGHCCNENKAFFTFSFGVVCSSVLQCAMDVLLALHCECYMCDVPPSLCRTEQTSMK